MAADHADVHAQRCEPSPREAERGWRERSERRVRGRIPRRNSSVTRGLDPRVHLFRKSFSRTGWIAGSSPAMTTAIAARVCPSPASRPHFSPTKRLRFEAMLEPFPASLIEGVLRKRPEDGARRGVSRRRLVTVRPGRLGTPPSRHYDLGARSSL